MPRPYFFANSFKTAFTRACSSRPWFWISMKKLSLKIERYSFKRSSARSSRPARMNWLISEPRQPESPIRPSECSRRSSRSIRGFS